MQRCYMEVYMESGTGSYLKRGFTFDEACHYLGGLSRMTVYRMLEQGQLSSYHRGVRRYFTKEALDAYIDRLVAEEQ